MTAPLPLAPLNDSSLAALAFVQAVSEGNHLNWSHMLDNTDQDELTIGLANLAVKLAHSLAAASGVPVAEVFEVHRGLFLHYGNPGGQS